MNARAMAWSHGRMRRYSTHCIAEFDAQTIGVLLTQTAPFGHLNLMGRFDGEARIVAKRSVWKL